MRWLRWALTFPAAVLGWYGGVLVGLLIHLILACALMAGCLMVWLVVKRFGRIFVFPR